MTEFPIERWSLLETGSIALGGSMVPTQSVGTDSTSGGDEIWSFQTDDWVTSSPTVADGTVFVGSDHNSVYALDADDGNEVWEFQTGPFRPSVETDTPGLYYAGAYTNPGIEMPMCLLSGEYVTRSVLDDYGQSK